MAVASWISPASKTTFSQFYPSAPDEREGNKDLFRDAKEHHRRFNQHELDHWYEADAEPRPIPEPVLREIVADWAAFQGLAFSLSRLNRLAAESYHQWGKNYKMHSESRAWLTRFLEVTSESTEEAAV